MARTAHASDAAEEWDDATGDGPGGLCPAADETSNGGIVGAGSPAMSGMGPAVAGSTVAAIGRRVGTVISGIVFRYADFGEFEYALLSMTQGGAACSIKESDHDSR